MKKVIKNSGNSIKIVLLLLNVFIFSTKGYSQEIDVLVGKTNISLKEKFTVTLFFSKEHKREFKAYRQFFFPDITDFEKGRTVYLEEEDPKGFKIIQYYKPLKTGRFTINPIKIRIKDNVYSTKKTVVVVSSKREQKVDDELIIKVDDNLEFEAPKLDVLLDIHSSKPSVYVGEGFGISVSLLISIQNKAELTFFDLNEQRTKLIKRMKSSGCFIEDFPVSNEALLDTITLKDKKYAKWNLYEGVFYPIDSNGITIPKLDFSIIAYALAKNKNESIERNPIRKEFSTRPVFIKVFAVPQKKGKEQSVVGFFKMIESVSTTKIVTGKSFKYTFTILGEGNIERLPEPITTSGENFDVYAPRISYEIIRQQGKVYGSKSFVYYVTPKEPGDFKLTDLFKWPYFDVSTRKFDTLTSELSLKVRGESLKNNYISVNNPGDFYNRINTDSNLVRLFAQENKLKFWANIFIVIMLVGTAVLVLKK